MRRGFIPLALVVLAVTAAGCAPRYVTRISSRDGQVKLLYATGSQTGLLQCKLEEGSLRDCKDRVVEFKE
jgi:hypothetical protein